MHVYDIKGHEVPLFPIGYVGKIFSVTRSGLNKKMNEGHIPPANFKSENGYRLFSIEDLAIVEYVYKEIWPYKQGIKVPDWVKDLITEAFLLSKKLILQYGKSQDAEDWIELDRKYKSFSRYRLQIYIDSWRRMLLDTDKFFPELVDNEDDW